MDLKTALFDLDGVVFDTEPIYTRFWGEECRRYHPELPGLEHRIKGQTLQQIFDGYFADVPQEQPLIVERLNRFESQMQYDYIPGFTDFIVALRSEGITTAVVTSSNRIKMQAVYRAHPEVRDFFDRILTSEDHHTPFGPGDSRVKEIPRKEHTGSREERKYDCRVFAAL